MAKHPSNTTPSRVCASYVNQPSRHLPVGGGGQRRQGGCARKACCPNGSLSFSFRRGPTGTCAHSSALATTPCRALDCQCSVLLAPALLLLSVCRLSPDPARLLARTMGRSGFDTRTSMALLVCAHMQQSMKTSRYYSTTTSKAWYDEIVLQ